MDNINNSRRNFVKGCMAVSGAIFTAGCSWKYRGMHEMEALSEKKDGLLAKEEQLKLNNATLVYLRSGKPVLLVKTEKEIKAYESFCPHTACELNDGERHQPLDIKNGEIRCFLHDSYFDLETGKRLRGPAKKGSKLPDFPIRIEKGKIYRARRGIS